MKAYFLFFSCLIFEISCFAQISFEKGYFIDKNNHKTECFIKNNNWDNNPIEFEYKITENGIISRLTVADIKEFEILGISKYVSSKVQVDRTNEDVEQLSKNKNPQWSTEQLFLKVLVTGKASLYFYQDGNIRRFFYSNNDSSIIQLVYKPYLVDYTNINYNLGFRQQLVLDVNCSSSNTNAINYLDYKQDQLEKYFKKFNKCKGDTSIVYDKDDREKFNLKVITGFNYSKMTIYDTFSGSSLVFDDQFSLRIGISASFFPFRTNTWGIVIEPTLQTYNSSANLESYNGSGKINYSFIDFPLGIRHYFLLDGGYKIFLNAFYDSGVSIALNSSLEVQNGLKIDISSNDCLAFGGGFEMDRFIAEVRYYTNRNIINTYTTKHTDFNRLTVIIGYRITKDRSPKSFKD